MGARLPIVSTTKWGGVLYITVKTGKSRREQLQKGAERRKCILTMNLAVAVLET